ncbi:hypothetical protein K9L63_03630 [Candidatus Gracilibacteria bacterium]|nr:hypothetical protein [Candidatus Gracilibacteria bacterium]
MTPVIGPDGKEYSSFDAAIEALRNALEKCCDSIFGRDGKNHLSLERYQKFLIESYNGVPGGMREHGRHLTFQHALDLVENYMLLRQEVGTVTNNDTIIIGGGGDGRLLKHHIALAARSDVQCIVFNDLNPQSVETAKKRLLQDGFEAQSTEEENTFIVYVKEVDKDIKVTFCPGDLRALNCTDEENHRIIAIFLDYYVGSEFLDYSSVKRIHEVRRNTFRHLYELLEEKGILFDTHPDADLSGLYRIVNDQTRDILIKRKLLKGKSALGEEERKNLMLEPWDFLYPDMGNHHHIRYATRDRVENRLMQSLGFSRATTRSHRVPSKTKFRADEIENMSVGAIRGAEDIDTTIDIIKALIERIVGSSAKIDPFAKFETTNVWRKNGH